MKVLKKIHEKYSTGYEEWRQYEISREYDENGNKIYQRDSNGFEESWQYDDNGNVIHHRNSDGFEISTEYDENGKLFKIINHGDRLKFFYCIFEQNGFQWAVPLYKSDDHYCPYPYYTKISQWDNAERISIFAPVSSLTPNSLAGNTLVLFNTNTSSLFKKSSIS